MIVGRDAGGRPRLIVPSPAVHTRPAGLLVAGFKTNWRNVGEKHGKTRFRIALRAADGYWIARHWIDDPEDAEHFYRVVLGLVPGVRAPSWFPSPLDYPGSRLELATQTFLTTAGSSQTYNRPGDWNDADNSIECVGGGGIGAAGNGTSSGGGGGGGAWAKSTNLSIGSTTTYIVTAAGGTDDTCWGATTIGSATIGAKRGTNGAVLTKGTGGTAAASVGTTKNSGGDGGDGYSGNTGGGGGGGGGGPNGAGAVGATADATYSGGGGGANGGANAPGSGNGGNNRLSAGGGVYAGAAAVAGTNGGGGSGNYGAYGGYSPTGGNGSADLVFDATHGIGSGSGGGHTETYWGSSGGGGTPGNYGAGAGGGTKDRGFGSPAVNGAQGMIVVTYVPLSVGAMHMPFP